MKKAKQVLNKFKNIKTVPHVAIRLTQMISENTDTMQEFEQVIKLDPTLVMRLLELVNSSYYSLRQEINSVAEALVFVGMNNLRNMIVIAALKHIFENTREDEKFSIKALWLHSASTGICSQMISERIFGMKGEDPFLCGILHDIGMIVEYQVIQEKFFEVCKAFQPKAKQINEYEQEIIGTDHTKIGAILVSDWKIPENIQSVIKDHHKINIEILPDSITGIIRISEYLVSRIGYSELPGAVPLLPKSLITHFKKNINEYKLIIKELPGELAKAKEILDLNGK